MHRGWIRMFFKEKIQRCQNQPLRTEFTTTKNQENQKCEPLDYLLSMCVYDLVKSNESQVCYVTLKYDNISLLQSVLHLRRYYK